MMVIPILQVSKQKPGETKILVVDTQLGSVKAGTHTQFGLPQNPFT